MIRVSYNGAWYRVPDILFRDQDLTLSDVAVFAVIADRASTNDQSVELTRQQIADVLGCSVTTVKRAIAKLTDKHYISARHRAGAATIYTQLLLEPKRRSGSPRKSPKEDDGFDVEKYKVLINCFPADKEVSGS